MFFVNQSIGSRIRTLRKARNLTQAAFVGPNISSGYLSLIEKGQRNPSAKALERIALVLGISVSEIMGEESKKLTIVEKAEVALLNSLVDLGDLVEFDMRFNSLPFEVRNSLAIQTLEARVEAEKGNVLSAFTKLEEASRRDFSLEDSLDVWDYVNSLSLFSTQIGNQTEVIYRLRAILDSTNRVEHNNLYLLICCVLSTKLSELGDHGSAFRLLFEARSGANETPADFVQARLLWSEAANNFNKGDYLQAMTLAERAKSLMHQEKEAQPLNRIDHLLVNCLIYAPTVSESEIYTGLSLVDARLQRLEKDKRQTAQRLSLEIQKVELLAKLGRATEALSLTSTLIKNELIAPVDLPLLHLLACELKLAIKDPHFDRYDLETSINSIQTLAKSSSLLEISKRQIKLALKMNEIELAAAAFDWYSNKESSKLFFTNTY